MPVRVIRFFSIFQSTKTMNSNRYFKNPFSDYDGKSSFLANDGTLEDDTKALIKSNFTRLFRHWEKHLNSFKSNDISAYTGITGAAILYLKIYETKIFSDYESYLQKAYTLIQSSLVYYRQIKVPTYMCGEVGLLTTAALIYNHLNKDYKELIQNIVSIESLICNINSDVPDEVLYGRAGYLYSLLLLRSKIPETASIISDHLIRKIIAAILNSGMNTANKLQSNRPLTYFWYDQPYVGAAHGYAGILYLLLKAVQYINQQELQTLIKPTIDSIVNLQFRSGNFPACIGENEDKLIHWCHGSPGLIYLLSSAYTIFNDQNYLNAILKAGENIWQKGLLKKGYGLCHGTSGNAYAFLTLFSLTKDQKHLYRAIKFAEWCCNYGKHNCRLPDTPYSLFEGMAGTLYFLLDIVNPLEAKFPAFQLS